jgi:hypothetical protein
MLVDVWIRGSDISSGFLHLHLSLPSRSPGNGGRESKAEECRVVIGGEDKTGRVKRKELVVLVLRENGGGRIDGLTTPLCIPPQYLPTIGRRFFLLG